MPRPMRARTGRRLCGISRPCFRLKCRPFHDPVMIRVLLPAHLRTLGRIEGEVQLDVEGEVTPKSILNALEARFPMLRGTIRDPVTQQRRPFVRYFACAEDLSHDSPDAPVPDAVARGVEPFLIVGAVAGGT